MLIEHQGRRPSIHQSAYIAPNATVCGDVTIGQDTRVMFGAVIVAQGGPVHIGSRCVIMENAVIRGTGRHPTRLGDHVLVGPHAHLTGCTIEDSVFLATGCSIFNAAHIATRSIVRINGIVHIKTVLKPDTLVPIGWIAVGDPPEIRPTNEHDQIWAVQESLDFPGTVFGLKRAPVGQTNMPEMTRRYCKALARHAEDRTL